MNSFNKFKTFATVLLLTIIASVCGQSNPKFKVTLDAGHGGKDFGAVYNGHIEKNIALAVVLKVGKILEDHSNILVNYTRKTDVFIDLVERANIANRIDATIFVSIHCNANKNTAADGTETYVMGMTKNASSLAVAKSENEVITLEKDYKQKYEGFDPNNPSSMLGVVLMQEEYLENSISLASKIEDSFVILGKKVRGEGVKQAPYMVLHKAYMPRVLIEMGFISNPIEGNKLDSEEGQDEIAKSVAEAIIGYKKEYFGSGVYDENHEKPSQKIVEKVATEIPVVTKNEIIANKLIEKKPEVKSANFGVIYKVQIAAVAKKIDVIPTNFKGLKNISINTDNGVLYKYTYGETADYATAKENLEEAKSKGYVSAYLIAFKDGKKISIQEATK